MSIFVEADYGVEVGDSNALNLPTPVLYQQALHWDPQVAQVAIDELARRAANGDVKAQACLNDVLDALYARRADGIPNAAELIEAAETALEANILNNPTLTTEMLSELALSVSPTVARVAVEELLTRAANGDQSAQYGLEAVIVKLTAYAKQIRSVEVYIVLSRIETLLNSNRYSDEQLHTLSVSGCENLASYANAAIHNRALLGG